MFFIIKISTYYSNLYTIRDPIHGALRIIDIQTEIQSEIIHGENSERTAWFPVIEGRSRPLAYDDDDDDYENGICGKNVCVSCEGMQNGYHTAREFAVNTAKKLTALLRVTLPFSLREIRGRRTRGWRITPFTNYTVDSRVIYIDRVSASISRLKRTIQLNIWNRQGKFCKYLSHFE